MHEFNGKMECPGRVVKKPGGLDNAERFFLKGFKCVAKETVAATSHIAGRVTFSIVRGAVTLFSAHAQYVHKSGTRFPKGKASKDSTVENLTMFTCESLLGSKGLSPAMTARLIRLWNFLTAVSFMQILATKLTEIFIHFTIVRAAQHN